MNRRQRLVATLRGEPVDRPAVSFYEIGGIRMDPSDPDPFNIYSDPSWQPLIELAEEQTDLIRMRSAVRANSHESWAGSKTSAGSIRSHFFKTEQVVEKDVRLTRLRVEVGGRVLTSMAKRYKDVDTIWTVEPLLKEPRDIETYLQIPDAAFAEEVDVSDMIREEAELGDRGIVMVDTEDPLCAAATLFSMEDFTIVAMTEQSLFHRLVEKCARTVHARTERVAREFAGRLWRIYGAEFASEPYLPPNLFDEYVVRYTRPMIEMIHAHGGFVRIHCHGRTRALLKMIVDMGADATDPIEPPPHGDVDLAFVRAEYGKDLVCFGNIEVADIENLPAEAFAKVVDKTLDEGTRHTRRGFVAMPSASPYGRNISENTLANYRLLAEKVSGFKRR